MLRTRCCKADSESGYENLSPMVMNFNGDIDYDIDFEFEDDNIAYGCTATLNGEMWLLGGPWDNTRQVII